MNTTEDKSTSQSNLGGSRTHSFGRLLLTGVGVTLIISAMWVVIALLNPTVTYHLSPLLVAAAPSVVARLQAERALPWRQAVIAAAVGGLLAGITTLILVLADALRGPVITAEFTAVPGSALAETLVVLAMGAVLGGVFAAINLRRRHTPTST